MEENKNIEDSNSININETEEKVPVSNPEGVIEAILFAMGNSVEYSKLADVLNISVAETKEIISDMQRKYEKNKNRGVSIVELEDSVQMCTKTDMYEHLIKVATVPKRYSLSDAALETLSIVAYKQPVTRLEIEKIRGVNCDYSVNKLIEYGLIAEIGRLDAPGKPLLFGTTEDFLRSFGVKSLEELPVATPDRIEEFKREAAEEMQMKLDI